MAYAEASDVAALLARELSAEETALVERRLAQVERMILRRIPDLSDQITDETIDLADVVDIEAEAVLRLVRNPEGLYSETDGNYSYQFSRETASGKLEILPNEWETLGVRPSRMFAIAPYLAATQSNTPFGSGV